MMANDVFDARVLGGDLPPLDTDNAREPLSRARVGSAQMQTADMTKSSVAKAGGAPTAVRRSDAYVAAQIARAVARGRRVL